MITQLQLKLENLPGVYRFDGGENEKRWMSHGMPKGIVPDQYIERCDGGAVNLHILRIGDYDGCYHPVKCKFQQICSACAGTAGEQMD